MQNNERLEYTRNNTKFAIKTPSLHRDYLSAPLHRVVLSFRGWVGEWWSSVNIRYGFAFARPRTISFISPTLIEFPMRRAKPCACHCVAAATLLLLCVVHYTFVLYCAQTHSRHCHCHCNVCAPLGILSNNTINHSGPAATAAAARRRRLLRAVQLPSDPDQPRMMVVVSDIMDPGWSGRGRRLVGRQSCQVLNF